MQVTFVVHRLTHLFSHVTSWLQMAAVKDALLVCLFLSLSYGHDTADVCITYYIDIGSTLIMYHNGSQCHHFMVNYYADTEAVVVGVTFQIHTQSRDVTLSTSLSLPYDSTTNGTHVGLVQFSSGQQWAEFYATFEPGPTNGTAKALVAAVPINMNDPVAGACATTSNLLYDAELALTHTDYSTTITFQDGDLGYGSKGLPTCDTPSPAPIQDLSYYGYMYFLPERTYSEDSMFEGIKRMLIADNVTRHGQMVFGLLLTYRTPKRVVFDSMPEQGVVYNMLVSGEGRYGAYIPVATYSCDYSEEANTCIISGSIVTKVTGAIIGVVGLYVCFIGHRFFHIEVPILTSTMWTFVFYCILEAHSGWSELVIQLSSIALSAIPTALITALWFLTGHYFSLVFIFAAFGTFHFTLILLFTPLGFLSFLDISYVYGLSVFCVTVVVLVPFMMLELIPICCKECNKGAITRITNIIACAFLGSTAVIYAISTFLLTTLRLIWANFLNRVTIAGFDFQMYQAYPFQLDEILLCLAWLVLFVLGIVVQSLLSCRRPPFPSQSLYRKWSEKRKARRERRETGLSHNQKGLRILAGSPQETSPLLGPGASRGFRRLN